MEFEIDAKFEVETILKEIAESLKKDGGKSSTLIKHTKIHLCKKRLLLFYLKGCDCFRCGIKGSYFALQRQNTSRSGKYHLALYATNTYGVDILMTMDHIYPKALGGLDTIENLQPMCDRCNHRKKDKVNWKLL